MQEDAADGQAFGEALSAEHGGPRRRQRGLVHLGEIDQSALGHDFGQHHGDRRQRFFFLFVIVPGGAVLHGEHAEDALAANDRHGEERAEWVFAGFRAVGERRMLGRVG